MELELNGFFLIISIEGNYKLRFKKKIIYVLFGILFICFIIFLNWQASNPDQYIGDISLGFKGEIIEKYNFRALTHLKLLINNEKKDVTSVMLIRK